MIGEIISGGLSLLGGLFGSKKKQTTETTVDYVKMAKSAEAAGFNPLTALRNGGSAGFTSTVSHPGLSGVTEAVSQIGGAIGSAIERKIDPIDQKRQAVESALLDYQLGTIQNKAKAPMMFGDVPGKAASGRATQLSAPLSASYGKKAAPAAAVVASRGPANNWLDAPAASQDDFPIWIAGKDRDGKRVWIPNPDGPDLEQAAYAGLTRVQSGYEAVANSLMNWRQNVSVKKLSDAQKKELDESWVPSWVPRIKVSW